MTDTLLTDYLTPTELAVELGVCARTIERWHRLREAPPRTKVGCPSSGNLRQLAV